MANSITIQLRPTRNYDKPSVANLFHNAGLSKANYWIKNPDSLISNLDLKKLTTRDAVSLWQNWEEEATNLVLKNKGRNPQKKQVLIEEGLMVIGKDVVKQDPETFIQIFKEFKEWFEEKYNTKILAYFFHNHEGHIDPNEGEFYTNLHIHFFFLNVDKEGNSVRRQIKKNNLSYFQTKIYEIGKKYISKLQRATNYKELGLKAPKHKSHREYRIEKTKQTQLKLAPEIKSIKKENKELKEENKKLKNELAKVKDLKEENKRIREEFKKLGAVREDYAKLEQFVKKLKEIIKAKELTIEQMKEAFNKQLQELENKLLQSENRVQELEKKNKKMEIKNRLLEEKIKELEEKVKEQEKLLKEFEERNANLLYNLHKKVHNNLHKLKQTPLYNKFINEIDKQAPKNDEDYMAWLDSDPYSDEKFEEWLKENYTKEEIERLIAQEQERIKQEQEQQRNSWNLSR